MKKCLLFTYSICYWEVFIHFSGGGFSAGGIFLGDNFLWGGKFPGGEFSEEILHWGNLSELIYGILLMSCFLFSVSVLRLETLGVIVRGNFSPGLDCLENKSLGWRDFSMEE